MTIEQVLALLTATILQMGGMLADEINAICKVKKKRMALPQVKRWRILESKMTNGQKYWMTFMRWFQ